LPLCSQVLEINSSFQTLPTLPLAKPP
jgi:hypothetical protein